MEIGLSLGSNVGDRLAHLKMARSMLRAIPGVELKESAPVYECEPVGVPPEFVRQSFLNTVLIIETLLPVQELMDHLREVESEMGRRPAPRNAPRVIDIDVVYANGLQIISPGLIIPHPRWFSRRFVVLPLSELRPNLVVPGQSGTVQDVLAGLSDASKVECIAKEW